MKNKNEYKIEEELNKTRLDKVAVTLDSSISRVTAQRLIETGKITVNRKNTKNIIQSRSAETKSK